MISAYYYGLVSAVNLCFTTDLGSTYPFLLTRGSSCFTFLCFSHTNFPHQFILSFLKLFQQSLEFFIFTEFVLHGEICFIFFWNRWITCILKIWILWLNNCCIVWIKWFIIGFWWGRFITFGAVDFELLLLIFSLGWIHSGQDVFSSPYLVAILAPPFHTFGTDNNLLVIFGVYTPWN